MLSGWRTLPTTLPPLAITTSAGVALERLAEGIIGSDEEPGVAAGLHHRLAGAIGQHPGVVGPVDGVRRALLPGQIGRRGAGADKHLVLLARQFADRQRHARCRHVDDGVDVVDVVPLPRELAPMSGLF